MSVNKAILVGRLGRDPEVRTTASGNTVCNIRLATSERRKNRDGDWEDHTEWHSVTVFGKTAETAGRFLKKGRQVYIEGRIQTRKWQDKEGRDRYSTEVVGNVLRFLGSKSDSESSGGQSGGYSSPSPSPKPTASSGYGGGSQQNSGGAPFADDDIPFAWILVPLLPSLMVLGDMAGMVV